MILPPDIIRAAQATHKRFYPRGPFVSVALAQYGDESAWGRVISGAFNFFGIKANAAQIVAGKYRTRYTREQLPTGKYIRITQHFANYNSVQEAFDAHATLLTTPHYRDCMAAQTPDAYCDALKSDGYATEHDYPAILKRIIASFNLTQYDEY